MTDVSAPQGEPTTDEPHVGGAEMTWTWRYLDEAGAPIAEPKSPEFPAQADAESWVGEEWPDLAENGVAAVTLLEGDREVYGPMSLRPADPS